VLWHQRTHTALCCPQPRARHSRERLLRLTEPRRPPLAPLATSAYTITSVTQSSHREPLQDKSVSHRLTETKHTSAWAHAPHALTPTHPHTFSLHCLYPHHSPSRWLLQLLRSLHLRQQRRDPSQVHRKAKLRGEGQGRGRATRDRGQDRELLVAQMDLTRRFGSSSQSTLSPPTRASLSARCMYTLALGCSTQHMLAVRDGSLPRRAHSCASEWHNVTTRR
jgi:hypothetical protein